MNHMDSNVIYSWCVHCPGCQPEACVKNGPQSVADDDLLSQPSGVKNGSDFVADEMLSQTVQQSSMHGTNHFVPPVNS